VKLLTSAATAHRKCGTGILPVTTRHHRQDADATQNSLHANVIWRLEEIYTTATLVAILVMGAFAAMAAAATAERTKR
jgi:hypothetical protein